MHCSKGMGVYHYRNILSLLIPSGVLGDRGRLFEYGLVKDRVCVFDLLKAVVSECWRYLRILDDSR